MTSKTEERVTAFIIAVMIIASFAGLVIPLMNPSYYSKLMPGLHAIPMVQHNVEICEPVVGRHKIIDVDRPIIVDLCTDTSTV